MRAIDRVLAAAGEPVRQRGPGKYDVRCPAHDDNRPSLAVDDAGDRVLLTCRSRKCANQDIVRKWGLEMKDLFDDDDSRQPRQPPRVTANREPKLYATLEAACDAVATRMRRPPIATFTYHTLAGELYGAVLRFPKDDGGKDFSQITRRPGGWANKGPGRDELWPLYGVLEIGQAGEAGAPLLGVEGEGKVDAAKRIGLVAVSSQGGAKAASRSDWSPLEGRAVAILPDNDDAGREHAEKVATILRQLPQAATVRIVELPGLEDAGDLADLVRDAGDDEQKLRELHDQVVDLVNRTAPLEAPAPVAVAVVPQALGAVCRAGDLPEYGDAMETLLSRRFVAQVRGRLVYVRERCMWLAFDGRRWAERADHVAVQEAKRMHDELWLELAGLGPEERKAALRYVQKTGTKRTMDAVLGLAKIEPGVNVSQADFDAHPWLLNVENGVVDLRTGDLLPHDPELRLTQLAAVVYDQDARSELWERFIREVTCGDEEIARFLQQSFGIALTGDVSDEVLICHNGGGCNGKSTALEAIAKMLGDYAAVAPPGLFTARNFDSHPTEIASLHGKRFVTAIEQEANRALRESLVKSLTGGDTIRTRRMREDFWDMPPTWHIHVAYNRAPRLTGTDDGIRRRLRVVPWAASFKDRPDLTIKERLMGESERPGILAWCLEGLRQRLAAGRLESPPAVMVATDDYIDDEDLVGRFVADCCATEDPMAEAEIRGTLAAFKRWMQADGTPRQVVDTYTANMLGRELARRGFGKRRPDHGTYRKRTVYLGLRLALDCEYARSGEDFGNPFES